MHVLDSEAIGFPVTSESIAVVGKWTLAEQLCQIWSKQIVKQISGLMRERSMHLVKEICGLLLADASSAEYELKVLNNPLSQLSAVASSIEISLDVAATSEQYRIRGKGVD
ncbi:MAG TPA: hypothetical protein ENK04_15460 [Gammaproteobacteria bacterium]|nr:hypothetical protein [Gammaproteobacteria bacterium]